MKYLFCLILFIGGGFIMPSTSHSQQLVLTSTLPIQGGIDTSNPKCKISSDAPAVIYGSATVLATIVFTKPVKNFVVADISRTNCSLSAFTEVTRGTYTVVMTPGANGDFSINVLANVCTDDRNIQNLQAEAPLTRTLEGGSGVDYDLENAAITISQHYRGHIASFSDCNDLLSTVNGHGMELLHTKNNVPSTQFANGSNNFNKGIFQFGRCDFGIISQDTANFRSVVELVKDVRGGKYATTMSYKNGITSYKQYVEGRVFYGRDSRYETQQTTLTYNYTGITDLQMNPRPVLFRWDYYAKASTPYYVGTQALGDSRLQSYINTVISSNGWYSDFVHWHFQRADYPDHYFMRLLQYVSTSDVFFGNASTIVEYYYAREAVTSISAIDQTITVNHTPDWPSHPYANIETPIYVKVDVTGTNLAGRELAMEEGDLRIRKVSTNVYYVPVKLNFANPSTSVNITVTDAPLYVNLNKPSISRTGNSITVDQPSKLTIWRVHKPTSLTTSSTSNLLPTADNVTLNFTVGTGLTIPVDMTLKITNDATHWFYATVVSYNSGTGALVVSSSSYTGSGTYSSWTIERWYHLLTAEAIERKTDAYVTSYTIGVTLDNVNYDYWVGAINKDQISNATTN